MSRKSIQRIAAIMLAALLISAAVPALGAEPAPQRRVVVLLTPFLEWDDLDPQVMPHTTELAQRALLANMNVRAGAVTGGSTPNKGALVLSAGAPLEFASGALNSFDASETVGETKARDLYRQLFGYSRGKAAVLYLGLPRQVYANAETEYGNRMGALGTAVRAAGLRTAAIGCGDFGFAIDPEDASRPAGLAAADEMGQVDFGSVSNSTLVKDATAPYGVTASISVILHRYQEIMDSGSASLIVVDPGDLARVNEIASSVTTAAAAAAREQALRSTDEVLGGLVEGLGPNDAILVVSQAVMTQSDLPAGYGPFLAAGPFETGIGVAPSTHRDGIVTTYDVSATILELLGVDQPVDMVGSIITNGDSLADASVPDRIDYLRDLDITSVAVESVRMPTVNTFIVVAVIVLIVSTLLLYRGPDGLPAWTFRVAKAAVLLVECILLASILQFAVWLRPPTGVMVLLMLTATTVVCFGLIWLVSWRRAVTMPLVVTMGSVALVVMVDQWMGAPLSLIQVFGYSPLLGARYYGLGNEMAGVLLGSVMMTVAVTIDTWRDRAIARHLRTWGWPLIGVVTLVTTTAPLWGANVGAVAWMTVAFLVGWMLLNGRRVWTWRNVIAIGVIVVLVVAGLAVVDVSGGAASTTHLGRVVMDVQEGGFGGLWTMVVRKAETNIRVLGRTNWTWMLIAVLLLLGYMRWRPHGEFAALLKENPAFSAALAAALFAGTVGYFTEDSGIIIPALMFVPVGVTALFLMLSRPQTGDAK